MIIVQLMKVAPAQHNRAWLKEALQAAIQLELATLPPYLCALWSIKDGQGKVYDLLHDIVMEEMLHMGLACNLLTTVGGTPVLNTDAVVPKYPGPLPGGVRPELTHVALTRLTKEVVKDVFMEIEYPQYGPIAFELGATYPTIGAFYDAILAAFEKHTGDITGQRQLQNAGVGLTEIKTLEAGKDAIGMIKVQGEGTTQSPEEADGQLAHYYRFAEIYHGRTLIKTPDGRYKYEGDPIPFPDVFPMAEVPAKGYPESADFDRNYTAMLDDLQAAWPGVTLETYEVTRKGFLRMTVTADRLTGEFFTVPLPGEPEDGPTVLRDRFVLDWKAGQLVMEGGPGHDDEQPLPMQ
jgi:hypothetical protein